MRAVYEGCLSEGLKMDYKKAEIREHLEEWIMQSVHNDDEVIKNYKIIDPEKDGEKYYETLEYIMHMCFEDNSEYDMDHDEALKWLGDNRDEVYDYVVNYVGTSRSDFEELEENPESLVYRYAIAIGEDIVRDWMANPKHSYEH